MKACELPRGGLTAGRRDEYQNGNPRGNARLDCQKSAEAIVSLQAWWEKGRTSEVLETLRTRKGSDESRQLQ